MSEQRFQEIVEVIIPHGGDRIIFTDLSKDLENMVSELGVRVDDTEIIKATSAEG